jgi:plasmid stability protein
MPTLTIRNLSLENVQALKLLAKSNNRSLEAEARNLLERHARMPSTRTLLAMADEIASLTPIDRRQSDSAALLQDNRGR